MPTLGSLFDGIGGFPLAAVRNGIEPVWASEIEAFPIEVTRKRFPSMLHVGDITKLNGAELPPVDIRKRRSVNFIDFPQLLKPLFIGNDEWISLRKCGIVLLHGQPTGA